MSSPIYLTPDDDPEMERAIARARESFPIFWRELTWEHRRIVPGLQLASVKFAFDVPGAQPGDSTAEHMWVEDLSFDGRMLRGLLVNTADNIPGLVQGTPVERPLAELEDWMYVIDGVPCGGFTVQATRAGLLEDARAEHDALWGLTFPPPDQVVLTPDQATQAEQPASRRRGWGRLFGGGRRENAPGAVTGLPFEQALAAARAAEHPMSVNSTETIAAQLAAQPEAARTVLDDGWTLLHLDASGGNAGPVAALLQHGADRDARTTAGDTALDLAQRFGWDRVVALLRA